MFSSRLDWTVGPNRIAALVAEKRASGVEILDLTESNPTKAGIDYPAAGISAALADARCLRYEPEPFGLPAAREAVAGYYATNGLRVDPSRIVLTASTSEAYSYLFKLLCDPGDEILTPQPSYPLFEYLARLESLRVVRYPLFYDHGWHLDGAALRDLVNERTRAIVIVHPNNPTGSFLKQSELAQMTALALEHDLALISDEVFSDYAFERDAGRVGVVAEQSGALSFSLSGLSKVAGLPQMKMAWMLAGGNPALRESALRKLEIVADAYLSIGTPVQTAAKSLLGWREGLQRQILARVLLNRERLAAMPLGAGQLRLLEAEGGWYATLQAPRVRSEEEWVMALLRDRDVLVQPGFFYDFESEAFLVLSLLTRPEAFDAGLNRLVGFFAETA